MTTYYAAYKFEDESGAPEKVAREHHSARRFRCDQIEIFDIMTVAPGAADLTFGSVLYEMIRRSFQRVNGRAGPEGKHYIECHHCEGNDCLRLVGQRPQIDLVHHTDDCLLAKHLLRLKAMANKGAT